MTYIKCEDCRNVIQLYKDRRISCEIHSPEIVKQPNKCRAYLSEKCNDTMKIRQNNKIIDEIKLELREKMLG